MLGHTVALWLLQDISIQVFILIREGCCTAACTGWSQHSLTPYSSHTAVWSWPPHVHSGRWGYPLFVAWKRRGSSYRFECKPLIFEFWRNGFIGLPAQYGFRRLILCCKCAFCTSVRRINGYYWCGDQTFSWSGNPCLNRCITTFLSLFFI